MTVSIKAKGGSIDSHFGNIVQLRVGEALMFAPSAAVDITEEEAEDGEASVGTGSLIVKRLGHEALEIRVRNKVTTDGGRSIMAT
ncbi:hypothetical protein VUR80DRAFT_6227 [Thermomyces stellatus]